MQSEKHAPRIEEPVEEGCTGCKKTWTEKFTRWSNGGMGLLKKELGIDRASKQVRDGRAAICEACPRYTFGVCDETKGGCGCLLPVKVSIMGEKCPDGKW